MRGQVARAAARIGAVPDDPRSRPGQPRQAREEVACALAALEQPEVLAHQQEGVVRGTVDGKGGRSPGTSRVAEQLAVCHGGNADFPQKIATIQREAAMALKKAHDRKSRPRRFTIIEVLGTEEEDLTESTLEEILQASGLLA